MEIDKFHPLVLNVGRAVRNADWNWQNVCSPFARIYYVVSGEAEFIVYGRKYRLVPGKMYMIPPHAQHSTKCSGHFVHYYIHVYEDFTAGSVLFEEHDFPVEISARKGDELLFARLVELNPSMSLQAYNPAEYDNNKVLVQTIFQNKQRSEWIKMESRGIVYQLCSRFVAESKPKSYTKDERVQKAVRLIHERLTQNILVEDLSKELELSTEHFIRMFNKTMGVTPMLYFNQKRIEKAQLMLLTTSGSVKEVSDQIGYSNSSYFVRVFKRITGVTPMAYRRENSL